MSATATLVDFPRTVLPTDGHTTCLWHRQTEWLNEHRELWVKPCSFCGGDVIDGGERHELCRARAERGRPTPRLDQKRDCPCHKCSPNGTRY